jgi:hypothetical protein
MSLSPSPLYSGERAGVRGVCRDDGYAGTGKKPHTPNHYPE